MSFAIAKTFRFSASHCLTGLPEGHRCSRLHGHNYEVTIELDGPLDKAGMVFDYGELSAFSEMLDNTLDHRHINDVVDFNPTAELLAYWIYSQAVQVLEGALPEGVEVAAIRVMETPRTTAEFRR